MTGVLKSNPDLQYRYSIQFHNRFFILQNDLTDTIDDKCQHFITSNKETGREMVPKTSKQKRMKYSDDERVKQARRTYILHTHISPQVLRMKDKRNLIKRREHEKMHILLYLVRNLTTIWDKVFKSGLSKFCGRQPLKKFKGYGLLKQTISLEIF